MIARIAVTIAATAASFLLTAPAAQAANDCGYGYHWDGLSCVVNVPGPDARFIPGRPNCWINGVGEERCSPV